MVFHFLTICEPSFCRFRTPLSKEAPGNSSAGQLSPIVAIGRLDSTSMGCADRAGGNHLGFFDRGITMMNTLLA
jgi:hypothetical protein